MADTAKGGAFTIDAQGNTVWSGAGQAVQAQPSSQIESNGPSEQHPVEAYTGTLSRADAIPRKPIASMSYGGRVRIARLHSSWEEFKDQIIKVGGWAKSTRAQSADLVFVELNDGSCFKSLQVVINKSVGANFDDVHRASVGASFSFKGKLIPSPAKGQDFELQLIDAEVHSCTVLGQSDGTYPIAGRPNMEVSFADVYR
jgi:hypothetical protein